MNYDSTGKSIKVGDTVRWRGQIYTIKSFGDESARGAVSIEFEEEPHIPETPDEWAVDLVGEA